MSRVLVLDAESAAGVESIQSLGRQGATVEAASRSGDPLGFHSRYVSARFAQPTEPAAFLRWMADLDERHGYELIIPATEVPLAAFNAPEIAEGLRAKAILPSRESLGLALDKEQTWRLARRLAIPVPRSIVYGETGDELTLPYPVVVKPGHSKRIAGQEVHEFPVSIVRDHSQWLEVLAGARGMPFQVQEYVSGRGVGIELLFERGEPRWHFAHERIHEYPLTGGGSSYRRSIEPDPRLLEASQRLLRELNWHGVAMIEWKMNDRGDWYLVEINPRLWGSLALAVDAGVDFPAGLLVLARGEQLSPQPNFRVPYYTRNLARDITWQTANLRADHADPLLFTRSRALSLAEMLRPLMWRESWDHFDSRDLGVIKKILRSVVRPRAAAGKRSLVRRYRGMRLQQRQSEVLRGVARRGRVNNVVFVCYGNICRSPLAEYLLRKLAPELTISSCGFVEKEGRLSPQAMIDVGRPMGVDLTGHRSRRLMSDQIAPADLIVVMDWRNYEMLEEQFPAALGKTVFLGMFGEPARAEIADPYDLTNAETRAVAAQIHSAVEKLAKWIARYQGKARAEEV